MEAHIFNQLIFFKVPRYNGRKKSFQQMCVLKQFGNPCPKNWCSILLSHCTQRLTKNVLWTTC